MKPSMMKLICPVCGRVTVSTICCSTATLTVAELTYRANLYTRSNPNEAQRLLRLARKLEQARE